MKRTKSKSSLCAAAWLIGYAMIQLPALVALLYSPPARAQFGFSTVPGRSAEGDALLTQGVQAYHAGRMDEAINDYERARAAYTRDLGPDNIATLNAMSNLANAYSFAGRINEALAIDEQLLAVKRARFGDDNPATLLTMNNLALDYRSVGRLNDSLKISEEVLAVRRRTLAPTDPVLLRSMSSLAALYGDMGRNDESVKLNEQTLAAQSRTLGNDNVDTISTMNNLASSYLAVGRYGDAIKLAEQAVTFRSARLGADHPDTLSSMSILAASYDATGRKPEALALNEQTLALRRAKFGNEDIRTLTTMSRLASDYSEAGRKDKAVKLQEEVVGALRRKLGDDNITTLSNIDTLAMIYNQIGRSDDAIKLCQEMVSTSQRKFGNDSPVTLRNMSNLAIAYSKAGRDAEAAKVNEPLLELQRKKLGVADPATLEAMNQLAVNYGALGRFADAVTLEEDAYRLSKNKLGPDAPQTLQSMSNLAVAYSENDRGADALKLEEELVVIRQDKFGKDNADTLDSMSNLASIYHSLGRFSDSMKINEQVLAVRRSKFGDTDPKTLASMNNLAADYMYLGRFDDSLRLGEQVYQTRLKTLGRENRETLASMINLAGNYDSLGRMNDAISLNQQAVEILQRKLGPTAPYTLLAMGNLAKTYEKAGRLSDALSLNEQTLAARRKVLGNEHPDTIQSMFHLANNYFAAGRRADSAALRREALDEIDKRAVSLKTLSREERSATLGYFTVYYSRFAQDLSADPSGYGEALAVIERAKARSLLEELTAREAIANSGISADEAKRLTELRSKIEYFDGKLEATTDLGARESIRGERDRTSADLNALQQKLIAQYPRYAALSVVKPVTLEEARALIPNDGAFISLLFNVAASGVALALSAHGDLSVVKLEPGAEMVSRAFTYRWLMALPDADSFMRAAQATPLAAWQKNGTLYISPPDRQPADAKAIAPEQYMSLRQQAIATHGQWLSDTLLKPLAPQIDAANKWIISPDGILATIPWDTLPWKGAPLAQRKQITIVQSLSVYRLLKAREAEYANVRANASARSQPMMVMGGAVYDTRSSQQQQRSFQRSPEPIVDVTTSAAAAYQDQNAYDYMRSRRWPNLAGTLGEAQALHALMGGAIFTGQDASKSELRALSSSGELATFQNIHFAAHGYLDTSVPSLSALVLTATGTDEAHDGYITAGEWPSFNLKSDLLVMSACETGLGKIVSGEGVQGLPYALYVAGNRDTMLSIWQVSDEGASAFMERFWTKVKAGQTHAQALSETKLEFQRGDAGSRYSEPYYWAPFILYGVQD